MRRIGTTTRIIDRCIQDLFTNGFAFVYEGRDNKQQTDSCFGTFKVRMKSEHSHIKYTFEKGDFSGIYCFKVTIVKP